MERSDWLPSPAAEPPLAALDPCAIAFASTTSSIKLRARSCRFPPSGRKSRCRRFRPMFTPSWRACGYRTASGLGKWPSRDPINELGFQLITRQRPEFNWDEERNLYAFAHNNGINRVDIDGRIAPVIFAAAAWAAWQGVCAYLAASKAVEAFPGDDKKQHCFVSCFHNRCTGLFKPVFTLIGGALWELRPGGHADFDDVVADAYGIITSYHVWESCKTACDRCPVK